MTEMINYCYKLIPSGLKNVGVTYQRLMDKILQPLAGTIVRAYVDDMVVTSCEPERLHSNLEQLYMTIGKYHLKLNLEKCVFM